MKLPPDTFIPPKKITHYLLTRRDEDDKSEFLARAGYTAETATRLQADLRSQLLPLDAEFLDGGEYGDKYIIRGSLKGPNGRVLRVVSIWMIENAGGRAKFVTLYPDKT
jgi:hypothetical protein